MLEHLVNGVPPNSIPAVIRSHAEATVEPGESVDVPSVRFCRNMRAVLRVLVETLAAYRLAKEGRYLVSAVMAVRARAVAGREAGSSAAAGGHWSEASGKQQLDDAVERMVGPGPKKAEERAALGAALLPPWH